MSEFFDAHLVKCPYCRTYFASCEGPDCHCLEEWEEESNKDNDLEDEIGKPLSQDQLGKPL